MYPDCIIFDCQRPAEAARGWCWLHYRRYRDKGTPLWQPQPPKVRPPGLSSLTLAQRIFTRVEITDTCWLWTGALASQAGYGHMRFQGKMDYTHRWVYELCVSPIPDGLTIDHRCCTPVCCNPDHLEVVTQQVNTLRSPNTRAGINARKTHCKWGHEFTPANTYRRPGAQPGHSSRQCRICIREKSARARERRKARQNGHQLGPS